jgi:leucyl-tRNA synthetase
VGQRDVYVYAGYSRPSAENELGLVRRFLIADAYARFLRGRGDRVIFRLGVESIGEATEREAKSGNTSPRALVDDHVDQLRRRFESLGISCEWDQTVVSPSAEHCLRTQLMFLDLLDRDLIYDRGQSDNPGSNRARSWSARTCRFAEQCDVDRAPPADWTTDAVANQRAVLGRIEGVEIPAVVAGVGNLVVFTPHPDAIERAAFVAVSPNHPEIDLLAGDADLTGARTGATTPTGLQVAVPGVDGLIPLVFTSEVDARFGPTATLGIPAADETDRRIEKQLPNRSGMSMTTTRVHSKPTPAIRYRLPDLSISREAPWGVPIPIVHCQQCGPVPIPATELPLLPQGHDGSSASSPDLNRACPKCGGPAKRDAATIDWNFDSMWMWPALCAQPEGDASQPPDPGRGAWATPRLTVWSSADSDQLLLQRVAGHMLRRAAPGEVIGEEEPLQKVVIHGSLGGTAGDSVETAAELDGCIARIGGDAVRFAILNAGSPARTTHLHHHLLTHAERFIGELVRQVESVEDRVDPIPEEIDPSTPSRRRLAAWSRTATERITTHLERLDLHRATYAAVMFQQRISAFEADRGERDEADQDAIAVALVRLGRMAEPLLPELGGRLGLLASSGASAPSHSLT